MLAHYTQAAMVAESRRLCVPASADSLPTSAMQEDHVSMGWGAARKLRTVVANLGCILAVELTCAARALVCAPRWIRARARRLRWLPCGGHSRARAGSLAGSGAGGGRGAGRLGRPVEAVEGAIGSLE